VALSCRKDCGREALHKRLRARLGLDGLPLHLVYLDEFLLDPRVPEMERHLLLLALDVELAGGNREHEVCVVLVVYNFESQATQAEVFFLGVFACVSFPLLSDGARCLLACCTLGHGHIL